MHNDEVGKYYKRKSQKSKSSHKSNHKHEKAYCIIKSNRKGWLNRAEYCPICFKIQEVFFFEMKHGAYMMTLDSYNEALLDEYADLDIYRVNDTFDRFITDRTPISREEALL